MTNSTLTTLNLFNNLIGQNGAQVLSEALKFQGGQCRVGLEV